MAQDIRPFLVRAARDVVVEGVKAYMRGRGLGTAQIERAERVTVIDVTPQDSECPYCSIALFLAGARLYLQRAVSRHSFTSVYRGLARHRLYEAGKAARQLPPGLDNLLTQRQIHTVETGLNDEAGISNQQAMQAIDAICDRVLDLAEQTKPTR